MNRFVWRTTGVVLMVAVIQAVPGQEQYKKIHRDAAVAIEQSDYDGAIKIADEFLQSHPNDLESFYILSAAYSLKQDIPQAITFMRLALDAGLPAARFIAGPRKWFDPLRENDEFRAAIESGMKQLVQGPLLGCVTDRSAKFWVRMAQELPVQVLIREKGRPGEYRESDRVDSRRDCDYTAALEVDGLKPSTEYEYRMKVDGELLADVYSFRSAPAMGQPTRIQVGFGGGAGYTPGHERMWTTLAARHPDAFLFLGDNVYIDSPEYKAVQQYCYYRRQSRPEFRHFTSSTPIYAIWDDHDFCTNDGRGDPDIDRPAWKIPVWRTFQEQWLNPAYGGGERNPGCWFSFSIGDIDFLMLDGRYYRSDPRQSHSSMLGPVQKQWLLDRLRQADGTFTVLVSPVPWADGTKPGSLDTWEGYREERDELFACIAEHQIDGVIFLSADRHRSDVWKIEHPGGYDFYEFESSKLTNEHTHQLMPNALFGYNEKCSYGRLTFDTTLQDPQVTFEIITIDDEVVYTLTLPKSRLSFSSR